MVVEDIYCEELGLKLGLDVSVRLTKAIDFLQDYSMRVSRARRVSTSSIVRDSNLQLMSVTRDSNSSGSPSRMLSTCSVAGTKSPIEASESIKI